MNMISTELPQTSQPLPTTNQQRRALAKLLRDLVAFTGTAINDLSVVPRKASRPNQRRLLYRRPDKLTDTDLDRLVVEIGIDRWCAAADRVTSPELPSSSRRSSSNGARVRRAPALLQNNKQRGARTMTRSTMTPDRTEAERFLKALDPSAERFTFQTFDDDPERRDRRRETGEKDPLAKIKHGTLAQHWRALVKLNDQGAGIFFTVNVTNFEGRTAENIVGIRAQFCDLDAAPLEPVLADDVPRPHIITETSPRRWHAYWRVEDGLPLGSFTPLQEAIAARFNGDAVIIDYRASCDCPVLSIARVSRSCHALYRLQMTYRPTAWARCAKFSRCRKASPRHGIKNKRGTSRWGDLNERALKSENLKLWVPQIFSTAKRTKNGAYRVASADIGRGFQEDLGLDPRGIKMVWHRRPRGQT